MLVNDPGVDYGTGTPLLPLLRRSPHPPGVNLPCHRIRGSTTRLLADELTGGVVWAAMLPDDRPSGGFHHDGHPPAW